jgi:L-ascorbate metabolism protein UlaG (beta-lactamase superfamily)
MHVEWYGQSFFRLTGAERSVVIDPHGDLSWPRSQGLIFDYPAVEGLTADLVLVTHEHGDHNGIDTIGGEAAVLRSTAGTLESPVGTVMAIASEHDDVAGTQRGPNTIFAFELDGLRVAHFGDFGQRELRPQQAAALGGLDLLFIPVGDGPTIGGAQAAAIVDALRPRWVVPMHYRTPRLGFLETADDFLERAGEVHRAPATHFETSELPASEGPLAVVPAVP